MEQTPKQKNQSSTIGKTFDHITWNLIRGRKDKALVGILKRIPFFITPNLLVYLRFLLSLFLLWLFINQASGIFGWLFGIYIFCKIIDLFDGSLARFRGQASAYGELIDPVSDRLLNIMSLAILFSLWPLFAFQFYFCVNLIAITMFIFDYLLSCQDWFSFRLIYFRKIFDIVFFIIAVAMLIVELIR
jgi:phosphatidylglycerophosphate synthase